MTKKSLSNGWVINFEHSLSVTDFFFWNFLFWQVSLQKSGNRDDAIENGKRATVSELWQTNYYLETIMYFIILTSNYILQWTTLGNPMLKSLLVTRLNLIKRFLLTLLSFQGSLKSLMLFLVTMFFEKAGVFNCK